jgi:KUP system potassium uptake protein
MNIPSLLTESEPVKRCKDAIKSLGVVFGDIGISPIYTIGIIFSTCLIHPTLDTILGVLSLIIWTLFFLVMVAYAWLAMSLGKKGEGGTIVLKELLLPLVRSKRQTAFLIGLTYVGISLFFGDGVITPAISILSAVEGVVLVPGCHAASKAILIGVACVITILLFFFQRRGTERVSIAFGPLMLLWFVTLAISGVCALVYAPEVLKAFNPWYAVSFMFHQGWRGFLVLTGVILCATGGEALYADMGHLGRKPILRAWYFVFIALILSYAGQAAFLLHHPTAKRVLYEMIFCQVPIYIFIPFLILSLLATIIASQSMISGIFSVVYQGITTNLLPMFKVNYTSNKLRSQVYISAINWGLMVAVLFMIIKFEKVDNLAEAYGFAVTGTMTVTGIMMTWIFYLRRAWLRTVVAGSITFMCLTFFFANLQKIPQGGYWSIIIALCPLSMMLIYTTGQRRLARSLQPLPLDMFLEEYRGVYETAQKAKGTALLFVRDIDMVHSYVAQVMFKNNIVYEDNILISVVTRDDPFGVIGFFKGSLAPGFRVFEIHMGYMEVLDIEKILRNAGIEATVMFYGLEEVVSKNIIWKVFAFIKRISPSFVQFYKLPSNKLHGVVTSVEL